MTPPLPETASPLARRALNFGIWTWLGNAGGCLLGMIPLALPISIAATVVTLGTGVAAMIWGARAGREAGGDRRSARDAAIGFWLGAAHVGFVIIGGALAWAALHFDWFGGANILGH